MSTPHAPWGGIPDEAWEAARPWDATLAAVEEKRALWESWSRRAHLPASTRDRLEHLPGPRRVLVLTEDWCGDAARSVPVLATAFAAAPQVEDRYLDCSAHPSVLDRYLTHGGRSIPLAIVEDEQRAVLGVWGPRPAPLQALLRARRRELGAPTKETMAAWYAPIMAWYGKDAGRTTLDEILMLLERGGAPG